MSIHALPRHAPGRLARDEAGRSGGHRALTKLAFRRDRIMLPAWVYLITGDGRHQRLYASESSTRPRRHERSSW